MLPVSLLAGEQHENKGGGSHGGGQSHGGGGHSGGQAHEAHPSGGGGHPSGAGGHAGGGAARGGENHAQGSRPAGREGGGNANRPGNAGNRGNAANAGGNRGNAGGNRGNVGNAGGNRPGGNRGTVGGNRGGVGNRGGAGNRGGVAGNRGGVSRGPNRTVALRGGGTATFRSNGSIRSINRGGVRITNNIHGGRTIVSEHNNVRIVNRGGGGYVQHPYMTRGGHSFYSRTYYSHGVYRTGIYRGYFWHGAHYYGYYPGFWFHPGFYGWAYRPWGVGFYWGIGVGGWGWGGSPWWGYYGGWWNPYPVYASPYFWLTDWMISSELQAAYQAQYAAGADAAAAQAPYPPNQGGATYSDNGPNAQVTLSPEVKEAIAEEVKAQLAAQEQQAPTQGGVTDQGAAPANNTDDNQVPPALDPARRTFVVDNSITVTSNGQDCELTGGDVITRLTDTPDGDGNVNASVSASKKGECGAGQTIAVSVDDLMEMHNHFEEQLNNGLKQLAAKQGTNGMPKAPDANTVSSDLPAPQPDTDASKELSDQQAQADQIEQQAKQDASSQGGGGDE